MREGNVAAARAGPGGGQGAWPPVCRRARPVTSRSSTSCSRAGPTPRSPPCTRIWRSGRATRWWSPAAANPNGLIGASGRIGQKHQIAVLMDSLAPHYGDDFWFLAYHAMALSEDGQLAAARPKIERSVALNPNNAHGAHGFAHVCYESGEPDTARAYPVVLARHLSARRIFLRPSELASLALRTPGRQLGRGVCGCIGTPSRSTGTAAGRNRKCRMGRRFCGVPNSPAIRATPPPGARCTSMRTAHCRGRAAGSPTCTSSWRRPSWAMTPRSTPAPARWRIWRARGVTRPAPTFRRWRAASRRSNAAILPRRSRRSPPLAGENERIGGSRAQHDLIEFTLLKAYLNADRLEEARHLLSARRPGASGVPVAGVEAVH